MALKKSRYSLLSVYALTTFMSLSFVMTALAVDGEQSRISFISFVPKI